MLVAVFATLGFSQGPKLSSAQIDTAQVVQQGGQQLRLFVNQAVASIEADQITVTPAAAISVSTSGDVVAVQFDEPLRYNTDYVVEVSGVTSVYVAQPSTLTYEFTTASPELYYLDRAGDSDRIIRTALSTTDRDIVYEAASIEDYAVFDGALAVVTTGSDGGSALALVSAEGNVEDIALPGVGVVEQLQSSATTGMLGFIFTGTDAAGGTDYARTLFTVNLGGSRALVAVTGLDGLTPQVERWDFVPTTSDIVVYAADQSLLRVGLGDAATVLPLGQFSGFQSMSADGRTVVVTDPFGAVALNLNDGSIQRLDPSPLEGEVPFAGATAVVPSGGWVQQVADIDVTTGRYKSAMVFDDGNTARIIYRTPRDEGSFVNFALSPNGQYAVVETVPDVSTSVDDGYTVNPRSTSITTVFVDVGTGAVVKSIEGFRVSW
ncbi:hypothetical protein B0I08_101265 [Glaciihabitans tibetensis]|uniref:SbsA Ig-like domain-containing protein n=1 Tax=Glaciihabitans tibetensis TaxID=1266600 RepID=A0A2T0VIU8_9MICO|nr:hypothetical protein B0I08_101265 [Glaciihabitans tibetensis]